MKRASPMRMLEKSHFNATGLMTERGALSGQAYPEQIESFHERLVLRAAMTWGVGRQSGKRTAWSEVRTKSLPREVGSFRESGAPITRCTDESLAAKTFRVCTMARHHRRPFPS